MAKMRHFSLLWLFLGLLPITGAISSPIVAKVNGQPIYETELKAEMDSHLDDKSNREEVLDRLILFRLALQDAQHQGIDRDPNVRKEMEKILYQNYLERKIKESGQSLEPTEAEIRNYYRDRPLLRLRHLVLDAETSEERSEAAKTLATISAQLKEGVEFKDLVIKYSDDEAGHSGDLDFRGAHNLPEAFYDVVKNLKKGEVSQPVEIQGAWHLFQMVESKDFGEAPAAYLQFLRVKLRNHRTERYLASLLQELSRTAKIEKDRSSKRGTR
jgi:parvulin-like peptidyl-prolyl isomerase